MNKDWLVHNGTTAQEIAGLVKKMIIDCHIPRKNESSCPTSWRDVSFPIEIVRFLGDIPLIWCFIQVLFLWCWWQCRYLASHGWPGVRATRKQSLEPLPLQGFMEWWQRWQNMVNKDDSGWLFLVILLLFSCCFLIVFLVVLCWRCLVFVGCCSMFLICRSSLFTFFFCLFGMNPARLSLNTRGI